MGKALRLPRGDVTLVARAFFLVAVVRAAMFMLSVPQLRALARFLAKPACMPVETGPTAERVAWAVVAAARRVPWGRNCLAQAVAAEALLNRFGYSSEFRIGARHSQDGDLQAHAWLEREGTVLVGAFERETYAVMTRTAP